MNGSIRKNHIFVIKQGTMKTAEIKTDLYNLIERTEDINILKALKVLLKKQFAPDKTESKDFWDELPETVKTEIKESIKEADKGNVYTHEEVMQEMKEKYNVEL